MSWIRLDVGLLDDADFGRLSAAARGAYTTAYLLQKRRDGLAFADHAELCRLLRKEGIEDADMLVDQMRGLLESPDPDGPELAIRGYDEYQRDHTAADRQRKHRAKKRNARTVTSRVTAVTSRDGTHPPDPRDSALTRESVDEEPVRPQSVHTRGGRPTPVGQTLRDVMPPPPGYDESKKGDG